MLDDQVLQRPISSKITRLILVDPCNATYPSSRQQDVAFSALMKILFVPVTLQTVDLEPRSEARAFILLLVAQQILPGTLPAETMKKACCCAVDYNVRALLCRRL